MREKAPNHSIYKGAPCSAPCSIKSKSKTKFKAAMATTKRLNPIPKRPLEWMNPIPEPNMFITILTTYSKAIPIVAETIISLKFSVGFITPVLYKTNKEAKVPKVKPTA